jgi:hypothetical protein
MSYRTKAISIFGHEGYEVRERVFWFLVSVCVVLASVYFYAVSSTIRNISMRQHLEQEIASMTQQQSTLEFEYIQTRNKIDIGLATSLGYKRIAKPTYISRNTGGALSLNTVSR